MTKPFSYKYIYNPKTGRKVLSNGRIGRRIIKTFLRKIFQNGGDKGSEWEPGALPKELVDERNLRNELQKAAKTAHAKARRKNMTREEEEETRMTNAITAAAAWVKNAP